MLWIQGEIIVDKCDDPGLASIDLQLIRIETCGCSEGVAREGELRLETNLLATWLRWYCGSH